MRELVRRVVVDQLDRAADVRQDAAALTHALQRLQQEQYVLTHSILGGAPQSPAQSAATCSRKCSRMPAQPRSPLTESYIVWPPTSRSR